MKNLTIIAVSLLTLGACNPSGNNNITPTYPNTITVVDNGTTYTEKGDLNLPTVPRVAALIEKGTSWSQIMLQTIDVTGQTTIPIQLQVVVIHGPLSGIGVYADSLAGGMGSFTELFPGGQTYTVDTANIIITDASGINIQGTFWIRGFNTGGSKEIIGTINCPKGSIL